MEEVDDGSPLASWMNSSIVGLGGGGDKMASLDDIPYSGDELLSVEQFLYNASSEQEGSPSFEALSVNQSQIIQDEDVLDQERGIIDVNMTEQTNSSLGLMTLMVMEEADGEEQEEEHDHAHGGRQLMMEIGILTSLIMLVLALFILLVLPNGRWEEACIDKYSKKDET